MAKLTRVTQKIFGSTAGAEEIAQFGSLAEATPNFTTNPATIQALNTFLGGWFPAILGNNSPAIEDMNALFYLLTYQMAYNHQAGIPEYDAGTPYYTGSICSQSGVLYISLTDNNLGNPLSSTSNWKLASLIPKTPTIQRFTSGTGTYTLPTSPTPLYLKVTAAGGGGGGGNSTTGTSTGGSPGGETYFGTSFMIAQGGNGAQGGSIIIPSPGGLGGFYSLTGGGILIAGLAGGTGTSGQSPTNTGTAFNGGCGGVNPLGGAGGGNTGGSSPGSGNGFPGANNTGAGGGGGGLYNSANGTTGGGGGAGGYMQVIINSPSPSYSYTVGAGGAGGAQLSNAGGNGGSGVIIVEEFYQ